MGNVTLAVPLRQIMILFLPGCLIEESVKGDDQEKYILKGASGVILLDHRARTVKHRVLDGEEEVDCCLTALSWSVQPKHPGPGPSQQFSGFFQRVNLKVCVKEACIPTANICP